MRREQNRRPREAQWRRTDTEEDKRQTDKRKGQKRKTTETRLGRIQT